MADRLVETRSVFEEPFDEERSAPRVPWWGRVLIVFAASRVVTTVIMLAFANIQDLNPWTKAKPDYFAFSGIWDSYWYYIVAVTGYPATLPTTADGHVSENSWAFLPAFPALLRALMTVGIPWQVAGVIISVAFAAGASLLLYRLLARVLPPNTALFAVVLFCVGATSPVLQVGYAESMQLFFLFLGLILLQDRRYYLMIPVIGIAALTRPSGLAFAAMLAFHLVHRFVTRVRNPFPVRERVAVLVALGASGLLGFLWPLIAWIATGSPSAYTDTELAWRTAYIGYTELVPFQAWFQGAEWWLNWIHVPSPWVWGTILVLAVIGVFVALLLSPLGKRLGVDLRLWLAGYAVYLLAVFFPQTSTFRLLMPFAPVLGAVAIPKNTVYRVTLVVLGIASQVGWMYIAWWVNGADWSPP